MLSSRLIASLSNASSMFLVIGASACVALDMGSAALVGYCGAALVSLFYYINIGV